LRSSGLQRLHAWRRARRLRPARLPLSDARAPSRGEPRRFFGYRMLRRSVSSGAFPASVPEPDERSRSRIAWSRLAAGTSMPGSNSPRSRRLPSHGLRSGALARAVSARCPGWPAGTVAARVHRCAKTPA